MRRPAVALAAVVGALVLLVAATASSRLPTVPRVLVVALPSMVLAAGIAGRRTGAVGGAVVAVTAVVGSLQALDHPSALEITGWATGLALVIEGSLHAVTDEAPRHSDTAATVRAATPLLLALTAPAIAALGLALLYEVSRPTQGWAILALSMLLVAAVAMVATVGPRDPQ